MRKNKISLGPTVKQQDAAMKRIAERQKPKRDPLRDNPVVGFMSEEQAEGILREMRGRNE